MVDIGRQEGIEIDPLAARHRHTGRPVAKVSADADRLGMNALGQLDSHLDLAHRRFQPCFIAVANSFRLSDRFVEQDVVGVGPLADLVDPRILVALTTVDIREFEVDGDQIVITGLERTIRRTRQKLGERYVIR